MQTPWGELDITGNPTVAQIDRFEVGRDELRQDGQSDMAQRLVLYTAAYEAGLIKWSDAAYPPSAELPAALVRYTAERIAEVMLSVYQPAPKG